jgi:hypothetical protein
MVPKTYPRRLTGVVMIRTNKTRRCRIIELTPLECVTLFPYS